MSGYKEVWVDFSPFAWEELVGYREEVEAHNQNQQTYEAREVVAAEVPAAVPRVLRLPRIETKRMVFPSLAAQISPAELGRTLRVTFPQLQLVSATSLDREALVILDKRSREGRAEVMLLQGEMKRAGMGLVCLQPESRERTEEIAQAAALTTAIKTIRALGVREAIEVAQNLETGVITLVTFIPEEEAIDKGGFVARSGLALTDLGRVGGMAEEGGIRQMSTDELRWWPTSFVPSGDNQVRLVMTIGSDGLRMSWRTYWVERGDGGKTATSIYRHVAFGRAMQSMLPEMMRVEEGVNSEEEERWRNRTIRLDVEDIGGVGTEETGEFETEPRLPAPIEVRKYLN